MVGFDLVFAHRGDRSMNRPFIAPAMLERLLGEQSRHAWLERAAEQVRQYREEDRTNGIIWADEQDNEGNA